MLTHVGAISVFQGINYALSQRAMLQSPQFGVILPTPIRFDIDGTNLVWQHPRKGGACFSMVMHDPYSKGEGPIAPKFGTPYIRPQYGTQQPKFAR